MKIIIFDTETTKLISASLSELNKQPKIIEFGCVIVDTNNIDSDPILFNQLINPGEEITSEITKITGITNEAVADKPLFKDALQDIVNCFKECTVGIAHNAPFDVGVITYELERLGSHRFPWPDEIICSVQEYVHEFGKRPTLKDLYLAKVGKELEQTHRACDDAFALYEALKADNFFDIFTFEEHGGALII